MNKGKDSKQNTGRNQNTDREKKPTPSPRGGTDNKTTPRGAPKDQVNVSKRSQNASKLSDSQRGDEKVNDLQNSKPNTKRNPEDEKPEEEQQPVEEPHEKDSQSNVQGGPGAGKVSNNPSKTDVGNVAENEEGKREPDGLDLGKGDNEEEAGAEIKLNPSIGPPPTEKEELINYLMERLTATEKVIDDAKVALQRERDVNKSLLLTLSSNLLFVI